MDAAVPGVRLARSVLWLGALALGGAALFPLAFGSAVALKVQFPAVPTAVVLVTGFIGLVVGWTAVQVARTPLVDPPMVVLLVSEAPELHQMIEELAGALGVPPPNRVAVAPVTRPRLLGGDGGLLIPACWFWCLTVWELRQAVAFSVALVPAMTRRDIAGAYRLVHRIDAVPTEHVNRLVQRPLRKLQAALGQRATALDQVLAEWANGLAAAVTVDESDSVWWQADFAAEAWSALLDRFAVEAWIIGVAPRALCDGTRGLASAHVSAGLVDGVPVQRRDDPPATTLLHDPSYVDEQVSMVASTQVGGGSRRPIEWSDYVSDVVDPRRRRWASALISAVDRVEGRTGPASISRVLACLEAGGVAALAADLSDSWPSEMPQQRSERMELTLQQHIWGLVSCALVDEGVATDHFDWIRGHCLVHHELVLDLSAQLQVASSAGDLSALRFALSELGSDVERPVWIAGQETAAPRMLWARADVRYRRKVHHLVVCEDRLLLLVSGRGPSLKGGLDRRVGNTSAQHRRLHAILRRNADELLAESRGNEVLLFRDMVGVRVRANRLFWTWSLTIQLVDRQVVLRNGLWGNHPPDTLVDQLAPLLTDRLVAPPRLLTGRRTKQS